MKTKSPTAKIRKYQARRTRVRKGLGRSNRTWLTVFRSSKHIYAQLIDPETGRTLTTVSSRSKAVVADGASTGTVEAAKRVGTAVAAAARERNINRVVFNRNGFLFHGRVKALADAAREAGLEF
ncbi:MAG: 50S ribosomal protein L18 [Myxococcota bacterium]|jgi:large subunit ribosomal protein L18